MVGTSYVLAKRLNRLRCRLVQRLSSTVVTLLWFGVAISQEKAAREKVRHMEAIFVHPVQKGRATGLARGSEKLQPLRAVLANEFSSFCHNNFVN